MTPDFIANLRMVPKDFDRAVDQVCKVNNTLCAQAILIVTVFAEVRDTLTAEYAPLLGDFSFGSKTDLPLAISDSLAYAIFRLSAGYSIHPTEPNAAVVGPADPPYYVSKIPLSRTLIDGGCPGFC
ncbi:hypothetical protein HAP41_0000013035 [Bradyrhizobium barranii subsp. apii]|uniref:Uncharacterized protein n=1 Tax=Bradyrhizobium barranii subsp. apii TaxID=2819348 RepID=A0A8T5VMU3_9BRAD|nr:hypothetical protein [Bradyrhizobium barranii]UPT89814.1 hypothetical protein HAP41_0000013035 [Bradyrhizobium barranii subsp. apii]